MSEIRGQLVDGSARAVGGLLAIATSGGLAMQPTVANVAVRDRFCVVWQEAASLFGPWAMKTRSVDAASGGLSGTVTVTAANDVDPDLGSESGTDDKALLVWYREGFGLRSRQNSAAGHGRSGPRDL